MFIMQSKSIRHRIILPLLAASLGGCVSGGGFNLRNTTETVEHQGVSYDEAFTATREALNELGVTLNSSRDRGLIEGQIPPFKVKAVFRPGDAELRLEGVELDRNCWSRDSLKREWVSSCDGPQLRRKGVSTLDGAIALWTNAVQKRIP